MQPLHLPPTGYVRLWQIIGTPAKGDHPGVSGPIPVSKSTWWNGVRAGRFPQPVKIGPNTTVWRVEDIRALIESAAGEKAA